MYSVQTAEHSCRPEVRYRYRAWLPFYADVKHYIDSNINIMYLILEKRGRLAACNFATCKLEACWAAELLCHALLNGSVRHLLQRLNDPWAQGVNSIQKWKCLNHNYRQSDTVLFIAFDPLVHFKVAWMIGAS